MSRPSFVSRLLLLLVIVLLLRSYPSLFGVVINGFIYFSLFFGGRYIFIPVLIFDANVSGAVMHDRVLYVKWII